jgi:ABC-2 type transport system permease protein
MNLRRVAAVARRIVLGFRRDHRSLGLLFGAPLIVLSLVGAVWGSSVTRVPNVGIATDRFEFIAATLADRLAASTDLHGRTVRFDDGVAQLRAGDLDAVVWAERTKIHVVIQGADPLDSGSVAPAVQKAVVGALLGTPGVAAAAPTDIFQVDQLYGGTDYTLLDYLAPVLVAFFAFFFIFLLSAVSFLRERTSGTLERLMATPLRRGELVIGYLLGFSFFALLQALVIITFTIFVLKVHYAGSFVTIFIVEAVLVVGAVSLGLLVSAAARNELQAVQFVPVVLLPQMFLSGLLIPVSQLPDYLRPLSAVMPLTYANEALKAVMVKGYALGDPLVVRDIGVLVLFGVIVAGGAIASIRREVA